MEWNAVMLLMLLLTPLLLLLLPHATGEFTTNTSRYRMRQNPFLISRKLPTKDSGLQCRAVCRTAVWPWQAMARSRDLCCDAPMQ